MTINTPQHEPEVLASWNRRAMVGGLPDGWLTPEQAVDLMLPAAIDMAAGYAERVFLATISAPLGLIDRVTTTHICDMNDDADRLADEMKATADQRERLKIGRAVAFDLRLAELQRMAVLDGGRA